MWLHLLLACSTATAPAAEGSAAAEALAAIRSADDAAASLHAEISALQSLCDEPRPGLHLDARPADVVVEDMRAHLGRAQLRMDELDAELARMRAALVP